MPEDDDTVPTAVSYRGRTTLWPHAIGHSVVLAHVGHVQVSFIREARLLCKRIYARSQCVSESCL